MSKPPVDRLSALSHVKRALLQKRLAGEGASVAGHIPQIARGGEIRASFSQERMWLFQQMYPDAISYNSQVAIHFSGPLDLGALEQSLTEIVRRHEIYRTTLAESDGELMQRIHDPHPAHVCKLDFSHLIATESERAARRAIEEAISCPFRLDVLPLVRWTLIKVSSSRHILVCMDHHAVTDGWSRNVVFKELMYLYAGFAATDDLPELAAPRLQFADFAAWQRQWLSGAEARMQIDYWKTKLAGAPSKLNLPYDRPHPAHPSFHGGHELMHLGEEELRPLRSLATTAQATMFMTVLSVFLVMLRRYCGDDDICIGTGIANRRLPDTDGLIGMLINTVVLRVKMDGNPNFRTLLDRVRAATLEAYANQEAPFEKVVEAVAPFRHVGVNPLHRVAFNFQNNPMPAMNFPGLEATLERPLFNGSAKFDLYVAGWPRSQERSGTWQKDSEDVLLSWEYNSDVFDVATVRRMQAQFRALLIAAGNDPDRSIAELRMDDDTERRSLLEWAGNSSTASVPPVHVLFEEHAARTPEAIALMLGKTRLTYRELDERAERLSAHLRCQGIGPDTLAAVYLERSVETICVLLGILKSGGAYLPLDPGDPPRRLASRLAICRPRVIVASRELASRLPSSEAQIVIVEDALSKPAPTPPPARVDEDTLAYVLFTSGSTGEPKAVAVPHRAVSRLVRGANFARMDAGQVWLQISPLAFDASTLEIWAPLCNGGRLVLMPGENFTLDDIAHTINRFGVTSAWLTAGLFQIVANERIDAIENLEQLLTGGDVVSIAAARKVLERFPRLRLINGYGPTENTTFTCCHTIAPEDLSRIRLPIGQPIAGTTVHILDARGKECPIGVPGELCAGGAGLARGYWNDSEATAEKFFSHEEHGRMYHTGDLCRRLPGGAIEFLGRVDRQVKVRGYRVELAEIEQALRQCPGVHECVVEARGESAADRKIAAYIVPTVGAEPTAESVRAGLRGHLPDYASPSVYQFVKTIPLTVNGKVDYEALDRYAVGANSKAAPAPRTVMEEIVADVFAEVLGREDIGIDDDFFAAGGHSLAALKVLALIKARTGITLQALDFFQRPAVRDIAACAEKRNLDPVSVSGSDRFVIELRAHGKGSPLYILPGGWGEANEILVFARLLSKLKSDRPIYAVRSRVADESRLLPDRLEQQAADVLRAIAAVSGDRSIVIVGECAASAIAIAVAAQADAQGRVVDAVILLDPGPLSHLRSVADRVAPVPVKIGLFSRLRSWVVRLAKSSSTVEAPQQPNPLPPRVAAYYRLLGSWEPRRVRTPLHLILSSRFPDVDGVRQSWMSLAQGPLYVHRAKGDHNSYIRERASDLAGLLASIVSESPMRDDSQQFLL